MDTQTGRIDYRKIITDPDGAQEMIKCAKTAGEDLKNMGLTTSQIRALFGEVRQIEAQWDMKDAEMAKKAARRLVLLKPKMAYRARKERGRAVDALVNVLDPALDVVIGEADETLKNAHFIRFVEFFVAILAYHKACGGS